MQWGRVGAQSWKDLGVTPWDHGSSDPADNESTADCDRKQKIVNTEPPFKHKFYTEGLPVRDCSHLKSRAVGTHTSFKIKQRNIQHLKKPCARYQETNGYEFVMKDRRRVNQSLSTKLPTEQSPSMHLLQFEIIRSARKKKTTTSDLQRIMQDDRSHLADTNFLKTSLRFLQSRISRNFHEKPRESSLFKNFIVRKLNERQSYSIK